MFFTCTMMQHLDGKATGVRPAHDPAVWTGCLSIVLFTCSMAWPRGSGLAHLWDFAVCLGGLPQITTLDSPEMPCLMPLAIRSPILLYASETEIVRGTPEAACCPRSSTGNQRLSSSLWLKFVSHKPQLLRRSHAAYLAFPAAMLRTAYDCKLIAHAER